MPIDQRINTDMTDPDMTCILEASPWYGATAIGTNVMRMARELARSLRRRSTVGEL